MSKFLFSQRALSRFYKTYSPCYHLRPDVHAVGVNLMLRHFCLKPIYQRTIAKIITINIDLAVTSPFWRGHWFLQHDSMTSIGVNRCK